MSDLWHNERRLWTEGVEAYEELIWTECIMVFGPMGVMRGEQISDSLREAPRWSDVEITEQTTSNPSETFAILAYKARAIRGSSEPYHAICTSSYVCVDGYWWLAHHQQTSVSLIWGTGVAFGIAIGMALAGAVYAFQSEKPKPGTQANERNTDGNRSQ